MKNSLKITFLTLLVSISSINANNIFVSTSGNNNGEGTISSPYKTIQFGVDKLNEGDTCFVRAGTYREQIDFKKSHTSLQAYKDEYVLISGANLVSGWEKYKGEIYRAKFTGVEPQFTQLFYKGKKEGMARYPDQTTDDMFSLDEDAGYAPLEVQTLGKVVFDKALPGSANSWKGGYFRAISAKAGAVNVTGIINTNSGKNVLCDIVSDCWNDVTSSNWKFIGKGVGYIFHLNALDSEGEWYYQNDSIYFWRPGGGKPTDNEVAVERREYTLGGSKKDFLTIRNINIIGSNLALLDCDDCLIDNCTFRDLKGWFARKSYGTSFTQMGGVRIKGSRNVVNSCYFNGSWGNLLGFESGEDNVLQNSILENAGWMSMFTTSCLSSSDNLKILWNTFGSTGRFHFRTTNKFTIMHNDFYDCMKMCQDAGSIEVTQGGRTLVNLDGSEIAYNKLHDMNTLKEFNGGTKQFVVAFYMENAENYTIHHNLIYNISNDNKDGAFTYLGPTVTTIKDFSYYNNTVWNVDDGIRVWNIDGEGGVVNGRYNNNIFYKGMEYNFGDPSLQDGFDLTNNVESNSTMFTDTASHDFTLRSNSTAIDAGKVIKDVTDGGNTNSEDDVVEEVTGEAPDCGCYEYGVEPWTCGSSLKVRDFSGETNTAVDNQKKNVSSDFIYNSDTDIISFKYKMPFNCNIYNFSGVSVFYKRFNDIKNVYSLDVSGLSNGVYVINLVNNEGNDTFKFIKK